MSSCGCGVCSCGCCEGVKILTPLPIANPPGLDVIRYRVGTHAAFFESMQARLSSERYPALGPLRTRLTDDFSIALLDAWATVAAVLSFYAERIAHEGFLRTATERRSVLELARLVGYAPRPGVAASVHLAYTLNPGQVTTIPRGSRAQSVPGPGELPQTFETSEALEARAELSALRPRLTRPQHVTQPGLEASPFVYLDGIATNLKVNDWLRLQFAKVPSLFQVGEVTLDAAANRTLLKVTRQDPPPPVPAAGPLLAGRIQDVAKRYSVAADFGVSAAAAKAGRQAWSGLLANMGAEELRILARDTALPGLKKLHATAIAKGPSPVAAWLGAGALALEAALADPRAAVSAGGPSAIKDGPLPITQLVQALLKPTSLQPRNAQRVARDLAALFGAESDLIPRLYGVLYPSIPAATYNVLAKVAVQSKGPLEDLSAFRVKAALFGHNLPPPVTFDAAGKPTIGNPPTLSTTWPESGGAEHKFPEKIPLDATYEQIQVESQVVIRRPVLKFRDIEAPVTSGPDWIVTYHEVTSVETITLNAHGVSSRVTVLGVRPPWLGDFGDDAAGNNNLKRFLGDPLALRATTVFAQSETLPLAEEPITDDVTGKEAYLELDGLYRGLEPGRFVIVEGERADVLPVPLQSPSKAKDEIRSGVMDAEVAMISDVVHRMAKAPKTDVALPDVDLPGDFLHTFIRFASPFAFQFKRDTVRIYANVVEATHGETKSEVLGSGDATQSFQTFPLKQPPLTYVAAPTAKGASNTLEVRVNDVLWHETAHFAGLEPADRRYAVRTEDDGKTSVVFGDGRQGARLPSGPENVRARYRSGIGKGGNVGAGQISLLLSKPLGVKEVINPIRAAGGADRDTRDQARNNVAKGAKALDRLVSVEDYADFAAAFAGIGKASAVELPAGGCQLVHVTIAGADDIPITTTSDLFQNLRLALRDLGDPYEPIELAVRELRMLLVKAKVRVLPDYSFELVEPNLRKAMLTAFGFERRALGQDVLQAEVLSVLHGVPGVAYVDLDVLTAIGEKDLASSNPGANLKLEPRVRAKLAEPGERGIAPAQLAVLRPEVRDTLILSELS